MKTIKNLIDYYDNSELNFNCLELLILDIDIQIKDFICNASAISVDDKIFINSNINNKLNDEKFYFVILHELAHYKRNIKYNINEMLIKSSKGEFETFFDFLVNQEIFADRYARFCFYILNHVKTNLSQNLDNENVKLDYKSHAEIIYNNLPDTNKEYNKTLLKFIK